jgi:hypothetical protein
MNAPTLLGHVGAVSGSMVSIRQFQGIASGIAIIGGRSYRVGQVGSFVRIPWKRLAKTGTMDLVFLLKHGEHNVWNTKASIHA